MISTAKKNSFSLIFFVILSFFFNSGICTEETKLGTLIVTYQTGQKGERLNRIRFRLKSEHTVPQMYPKDSNYVDDSDSPARTVVIENLPAGKYTLQFLIPNKDGVFDEVAPRELLINEGETLKIDQKIKPKAVKKTSLTPDAASLQI